MDDTTTLILVRHARVDNPNEVVYSDLPGFDLDPTGVLQAHLLGAHLEATPVQLVISSPLARARATATAIARRHALRVTIDGRLTEWGLSSTWTGRRWDQLETERPGELEAYLATPDDLPFAEETLADLASRMVATVESTVPNGATTVIVSHQDPVAALILSLTNQPLRGLLAAPPRHASATVLVLGGTGWRMVDQWSPDL